MSQVVTVLGVVSIVAGAFLSSTATGLVVLGVFLLMAAIGMDARYKGGQP
jgi:hypothetical protein